MLRGVKGIETEIIEEVGSNSSNPGLENEKELFAISTNGQILTSRSTPTVIPYLELKPGIDVDHMSPNITIIKPHANEADWKPPENMISPEFGGYIIQDKELSFVKFGVGSSGFNGFIWDAYYQGKSIIQTLQSNLNMTYANTGLIFLQYSN